MYTNTELLKETIAKQGVKASFIAEKLDMSPQGFWKKLNDNSDFKAWQMWIISDMLHLTEEETRAIFFAMDVD